MMHLLLFLLTVYFGVGLVGWAFAGEEAVVNTALSAGVTASDVVLPVDATVGFPDDGHLYIRDEAMTYSAHETPCATSPFSGEPACFTGVTRGRFESTAISHPLNSRVYNEIAGQLSELSSLQSRTAVDELGDNTVPMFSGWALVRFLDRNKTWDWPMFDGDFAVFRYIGSILTIAGIVVLGYLFFSAGFNALRRII